MLCLQLRQGFYVCRIHAEASHCQRGEPALAAETRNGWQCGSDMHLRLNSSTCEGDDESFMDIIAESQVTILFDFRSAQI